MESDFFDLYERQPALTVEVGHNSVADWCVNVWDRRLDTVDGRANPAVEVQDCCRKTAFANAYSKLTSYLSESRGGY